MPAPTPPVVPSIPPISSDRPSRGGSVQSETETLPDTEVEFSVRGNAVILRRAVGAARRGPRLVQGMRGRATTGMTTDQIMALTRRIDPPVADILVAKWSPRPTSSSAPTPPSGAWPSSRETLVAIGRTSPTCDSSVPTRRAPMSGIPRPSCPAARK